MPTTEPKKRNPMPGALFVQLPVRLKNLFKMWCADKGVTMSSKVEEMIENELRKDMKEELR